MKRVFLKWSARGQSNGGRSAGTVRCVFCTLLLGIDLATKTTVYHRIDVGHYFITDRKFPEPSIVSAFRTRFRTGRENRSYLAQQPFLGRLSGEKQPKKSCEILASIFAAAIARIITMTVFVGTGFPASVVRRVLAVAAAAVGVKSQDANSGGEMPTLKSVGFCEFFILLSYTPNDSGTVYIFQKTRQLSWRSQCATRPCYPPPIY